MPLEMARSSFSVSEVCQILCGGDGDEEYVFSGSDDDLGMDDLDDDDISGDDDDLSGDDDSSFEVHDTGLASLPSDDESIEQPGSPPGPSDVQTGSLPGPSGLRSNPSRLQSRSLVEPESPPPSPPPSRAPSRRGRVQCTRGSAPPSPPPSRAQSCRGTAQCTRGRAPLSRPSRGRSQPSRPAGGESNKSDGWSAKPSEVIVPPFTMAVRPTIQMSADPWEMFSKFFAPELIDLIVQETNRYAALCLSSAANTGRPVRLWEMNAEELKAYLGFSILMGLNRLPDLYDYWSLDECYHYYPIASRISRKRFLEIQRFLHFTDNATIVPRGEPGYDCLARIRPVISAVHDTFLANYCPNRENAIDEAMIKFKGRSAMKQYMPLKPTKRGFKVWARTDSVTGYMCDFEVYTGKADTPEKYLGEKVVKKLTRPLVGGNYHTYCDNFFTTVKFFEDLLEDGVYACGTFRRDRRGIPKALKKPGNCHLQTDNSYTLVNTLTGKTSR